MESIWKYDLTIADRQAIELPIGSEILCVQTQYNRPRLYVKVHTNTHPDFNWTLILVTYGTGHPMNLDHGEYIGTYQINDGAEVYHVYKGTK